VGEDRHPDPGAIERRDDHLAAELGGSLSGSVGIIDRERHAPVRGDVGLVVRDRIERRDHILEPLRSAALRHPPAEAGIAALEEVAVAPHAHLQTALEGEGLPAEHRAVEGLRAFSVGGC
jgi:hypothetical protein